jgi:hypothetical protein
MKSSVGVDPNDQNEVPFMIIGLVAMSVGAILAFFILRWLILDALDLLGPQAFTSFFGKVFLSVVVFGAGYAAFALKMKHRQLFAVLQICFALALNWVALAKFGAEFERATPPPTQQTTAIDTPGAATESAPTADDTAPAAEPSSWWRILKITVIWQCLFLACSGFSTLLEKGREGAIRDLEHVGKRVERFAEEH